MDRNIFSPSKAFIGVVHLLPLPGSPRWNGSMRDVIDRAEEEAKILEQGGVNGIIVENFGDIPFQTGRLDPETVAGMTVAVERVQRVVNPPGHQYAPKRRSVCAGNRYGNRSQVHQS